MIIFFISVFKEKKNKNFSKKHVTKGTPSGTIYKRLQMRLKILPIIPIILAMVVSCQKNADELDFANERRNSTRLLANERTFSYGETLLSIGNSRIENFVSPTVAPNRPGKFVSIPHGLSLNAQNGTINLNKSQAGQAYKIFFVEEDGVLGDSARVEIAGVDYEDAVFNLKDLRSKKKANANYNGRTPQVSPFINLNNFEVEDQVAGNGKLILDKKSGEIDLEASLKNGAFKKSGRGINSNDEFTIKYRVVDRRTRASSKISLKVYNFSDGQTIPSEILETIKEREEIMRRVNAMPIGNSSGSGEVGFESDLNAFAKPVRPPLIVIL